MDMPEKEGGWRGALTDRQMFYAQSIAKGHIVAKQNIVHKLNSDSLFMTHYTVENQTSLGKMTLNKSGRQKLGKSQALSLSAGAACKAISTLCPTADLESDSPGLPPRGS